MANKPLRLHPEAQQEYLTTLAWYHDHSLIAAQEFATAIRDALVKIRESPQTWPFYGGNFRKYTLRQFPFSIVYEELLTELVIYAFAHGSRHPGYWMDRI